MSNLEPLLHKARADIEGAADARALEQLRVDLLGKKGAVTELLKQLGGMAPEQRKSFGEQVNRAKGELAGLIDARTRALAGAELARKLAAESIDVTLPGRGEPAGALHPITRTIERIEKIFAGQGFATMTGPEIEDDFHNFGALNIPASHPARAMQDTFYVQGGKKLLRTHTSPVQIRTMENVVKGGGKPPIRIICPGRVYRRDQIDRTHSPMFHQIEGLYVAEKVTLADLKHDVMSFLERFFERKVEVRFRPSYFPFVEPGADVHIRWGERWLEVMGCGMVHPNEFKAVGLDPSRYTGYAFGMGVERMAMLRHDIGDLRLFFNNDLRFLAQFQP